MISLAILNNLNEKLVKAKDDGEAMTVLSSYLEKVANKDATLPRMPHTAAMMADKREVCRILVSDEAIL